VSIDTYGFASRGIFVALKSHHEKQGHRQGNMYRPRSCRFALYGQLTRAYRCSVGFSHIASGELLANLIVLAVNRHAVCRNSALIPDQIQGPTDTRVRENFPSIADIGQPQRGMMNSFCELRGSKRLP
jgi:hypothetical protein